MDGSYAPLDEICELADRYDALVMVDDSHAVGFVGAGGRGTPELFGVMDRVDILTGTLGKALGGASGGYVSAHQEIVDLLRQRSRPYLFSNAVAPTVAAGSLAALELAATSDDGRARLRDNATLFRRLMTEAGSTSCPGSHPIIPVMFPGDDGARTATAIADAMLADGVYVIAFSYPVVPQGQGAYPRPALGRPQRGRRAAVRRGVRRGTRGRGLTVRPVGPRRRTPPGPRRRRRPAHTVGVRRGAPAG